MDMKKRNKKQVEPEYNYDWSEFCDTYIVMDDTDIENPILKFVKVNGEYNDNPPTVKMKLNKKTMLYEEDENN